MILTLSVPDDVYKQYLEHSKTNPQRVMEGVLKQYAGVAPGDRALVLSKAQQKRLEGIFQLPIEDFDKTIDRIERLHQLETDSARVSLTPSQVSMLLSEAKFYKKSYSDYVRDRIGTLINEALG